MAQLPDHLQTFEHVTRDGDLLVVKFHADVDHYAAQLRNLGPAWDRLAAMLVDLDRDLSRMHRAYDTRRRARRRRNRR